MSETSRSVRVSVTGGVQGVGYRAFAAGEARDLGVTGWVRNRDDGGVDVHAEGSSTAVDRLVEALRRGPGSADVDDVQVEPVDPEGGGSFEIR